jgi:hypothetical protein
MSGHVGSKRFAGTMAALLLTLLAPSCAAVQQYSKNTGRNACASFDQCTVYDNQGKYEVACFEPAGEVHEVFAGDFAWPLSTGACQPTNTATPG